MKTLEQVRDELALSHVNDTTPYFDHEDGGDWSNTQVEEAFLEGFDACLAHLTSQAPDKLVSARLS